MLVYPSLVNIRMYNGARHATKVGLVPFLYWLCVFFVPLVVFSRLSCALDEPNGACGSCTAVFENGRVHGPPFEDQAWAGGNVRSERVGASPFSVPPRGVRYAGGLFAVRPSTLRGHASVGDALEVALSCRVGRAGVVLRPVFFHDLPRRENAKLPAPLGPARIAFARRLRKEKVNKINDIYTTFFRGISYYK